MNLFSATLKSRSFLSCVILLFMDFWASSEAVMSLINELICPFAPVSAASPEIPPDTPPV